MKEDVEELHIKPLSGKKEENEETSEKLKDTKKEARKKLEDAKGKASEKKHDINEKLEDVKKDIETKKEKLKEESEEEGQTPAEKVVTDIVSKLKHGAGQINEAIIDYNKENGDKHEIKKPLIDVLETNEKIIIIADISGVKKDEIDIGLSKNSLELVANYKEDTNIKGARFIQKERNYGKTYRKIELNSEIKVKEGTANYKDCTLTITLPKKEKYVTKVKID